LGELAVSFDAYFRNQRSKRWYIPEASMIELSDTIDIDVPPETLWAWFQRLPEHYREWHPDHISCRWLRGDAFEPGARMEAVEFLHGRRHRLQLTMIDTESLRRVQYRIYPGVGGSLEAEPTATGSRFTAKVEIGTRLPVIRWIIDTIVRRMLAPQLEAIRQHQHEEGINLKAILERRR
jgi:hypothetical protein